MTEAGPWRDYSRSKAILIGAWDYAHLPPVPSARNSLERMARLLTGPLCEWPAQRVEVMRNVPNRGTLPDRLMGEFDGIVDVALFYFVGHGQIHGDELCLALTESPVSGPRRLTTGLQFADVRAALRECDAQTKIVILDCCFAGHATHAHNTLAAPSADLIDKTLGTGAFTMAASGAYSRAEFESAPDAADPQTYFTKYLIDTIEGGIPGHPEGLALGTIFARTADHLARDRKPEPTRSVRHDADRFILARNTVLSDVAVRPDPEIIGPHHEGATPDRPAYLDIAHEWAEHERFIAERRHRDGDDRSPSPIPLDPDPPGSMEALVTINQNEFLSPGSREVHAIVGIQRTSQSGEDAAAASPQGQVLAVIYVIDCSETMADWLDATKDGVKAAISTLRDGSYFAVLAGRENTRVVYPGDDRLAESTAASRAAAMSAVDRLTAGGGREFGLWLTRAARLFLASPGQIRHVILATSGVDGRMHPSKLDAAVRACFGIFTADCRGVGSDWQVSELRNIADGLLGTVDIVRDPASLAEEFRNMTLEAMEKQIADVALRLWTPERAKVRYIKQTSPWLFELTHRRSATADPLTGDYPTGPWGQDYREYHVCIDVEPAPMGEVKLAGLVQLVAEDNGEATLLGQGEIHAIWTDDEGLSTRIDSRVAHYTGQAELALAIQEHLDAWRPTTSDTAGAPTGQPESSL